LLTCNIILSEGKINNKQYELLTSTLSGLDNPLDLPNPAVDFLPQNSWNKLCTCAQKDRVFLSMVTNFRENKIKWSQLYEAEEGPIDQFYPENEESIDGKWNPFMKLCVLKAMRPDRLPIAI
jgi:hypothetical protein